MSVVGVAFCFVFAAVAFGGRRIATEDVAFWAAGVCTDRRRGDTAGRTKERRPIEKLKTAAVIEYTK